MALNSTNESYHLFRMDLSKSRGCVCARTCVSVREGVQIYCASVFTRLLGNTFISHLLKKNNHISM